MTAPARAVAVDWSGRLGPDQRRAIWLAASGPDGRVARLEHGRTREAVVDELVRLADDDPDLLVGLDFSFSFPAWFGSALGCASAPEVWDVVAERGEAWLASCEPPFWGRPGRRRPVLAGPALRATEQRLADRGLRPCSTFQVGGAGAVGAGSIRGMPHLRRLRSHGFAVWPFDPPVRPVVVEVWPRLALGPVVKASAAARREAVAALELPSEAASSADALDAAVAARWLVHVELADAAALPAAVGLEGWIAGS